MSAEADPRSVADRLRAVRAHIAEAATAAGRAPADVRLIAVSKTHPVALIEAAAAAGQRAFGENTVQEALAKIPAFAGRGLEWHFIGHLQSNKARFLPGNFHWWHSLDALSLARRVARLAHAQAATLDALIEVNVSGDPRRHGVAPDALPALLEQLLREPLPGLRLRGLMTVGPHPAGEAERRAAFARLRGLRDDARARFGLADFDELSMGMSGDYVEAIREGATLVRIGSAIFGERDYSKRAD
jgi:hypothetical protein